MNEKIHDILDGNGSEESLNGSSADLQSLAEMRRLQEALEANRAHGALSAADKAALGTLLAARIGGGESVAPVAAGGAGSWIGSVALLLLGGLLGAGFFFLTDEDQSSATTPKSTTTGIIIEAEATTPALFPYVLPESTPHEECAERINELESELEALTAAQKPVKKKTRRSKRSRGPAYEKPVTGDRNDQRN